MKTDIYTLIKELHMDISNARSTYSANKNDLAYQHLTDAFSKTIDWTNTSTAVDDKDRLHEMAFKVILAKEEIQSSLTLAQKTALDTLDRALRNALFLYRIKNNIKQTDLTEMADLFYKIIPDPDDIAIQSTAYAIDVIKKARAAQDAADNDDDILKAKLEVAEAKKAAQKTFSNLQDSNYNYYVTEALEDEYDDLLTAENKANRLWYDSSKWTTAEKIGRGQAVFYAVVCGVATYVGLTAQEDVEFLSTEEGAIASAIITAGLNLYGFWDNVPNALKKNRKSDMPTGNYSYAYKFILGVFIVGAMINAAQQLSPFLELLEGDTEFKIHPITGEPTDTPVPMSNEAYWKEFSIIAIFGGATAVSLIGLFTQAPRKWFTEFSKAGAKTPSKDLSWQILLNTPVVWLQHLYHNTISSGWFITLNNGIKGLTFGDNKYDGTKTTYDYTFIGAAFRWVIFLGMNAIFCYAIHAGAPYAGQGLIGILNDFIIHTSDNNISEDGITKGVEVLAYIFVITRGVYTATIAQALAIGMSGFVSAFGSMFKQQYNSLSHSLPNIPVITQVVAAIGTLILVPLKAEAYCWIDAVRYARIQYNIKGSWFFIPHVVMGAIANHMHIWGLWNAAGNGAQNGHFFREGLEKPEGVPLTPAEQNQAWLATITGFLSSLGFYLFAAKSRTTALPNAEKYIEMKPLTKRVDCEKQPNATFLTSYHQFPGKAPEAPYLRPTFKPV